MTNFNQSCVKVLYWLNDRNNYRKVSSLSLLITLCLIFIPLIFLSGISPKLAHSRLADSLKESKELLIGSYCSICSTVPLVVELFLDFQSNIKAVFYLDRLLLLMAIFISSILYLVFHQDPIMPLLYVSINNGQFDIIVFVTVSFFANSCPDKFLPLLLLYTGLLGVFFSSIFQVLALIYIRYGMAFDTMNTIFYYIAVCVLITITVRWMYYILRNRIKKEDPRYIPSIICSTYLFTLWIAAISVSIVQSIRSTFSVYDNDAVCITIYSVVFVVFAIIVSILPGRLFRLHASNTEATLGLKRVFVRYVSHEIRSPLNVMYAGLEFLRSKFSGRIERFPELCELVDEISTANDTAVGILNDLLHYESIDAGTFSLDLIWRPVRMLLAKKLQPLSLLASKHEVHLNIVDNVGVTRLITEELSSKDRRGSGENNDMESLPASSNKHSPKSSSKAISESKKQSPSSKGMKETSDLRAGFVNVDVYRLDQVVRNLVTNAIKFTPASGTVTLSFDVIHRDDLLTPTILNIDSQATPAGVLSIQVTDTGVGISAENRKTMFTEFAQFDRNKLQQGGGSGLGLWICKKIVDMHSGHIHADSGGLNQGSIFTVQIPLFLEVFEGSIISNTSSKLNSIKDKYLQMDQVHTDYDLLSSSVKLSALRKKPSDFKMASSSNIVKETKVAVDSKIVAEHTLVSDDERGVVSDTGGSQSPSKKHENKENKEESTNARSKKKHLRILIVDDSTMNRKIIRRIIEKERKTSVDLENVEVEIFEADDGLTALALLQEQEQSFDIVFMDYLMKSMHGPEAVRAMRQSLAFTGRIVGVTGNALSEDISRLKASGANEVLLKPVAAGDICAELIVSVFK